MRTIYYTHELAAQRKMLPRPCPICGLTYGTLRIIVFNKKHGSSRHPIFSIGHYSPTMYEKKEKSVTEITGPGYNDYRVIKKPVKTRGKVWHSFQIDASYRGEFVMLPFGTKSIYSYELMVNLGIKSSIPLEVIFFELSQFRDRRSMAFPFPNWLYEKVKKYGWQLGEKEPKYRELVPGHIFEVPRLRRNWRRIDRFELAGQFPADLEIKNLKDNILNEKMLDG